MNYSSRVETFLQFHSEILNNSRDIYIYLPEGYDRDVHARYPVVYMHDGGSVFNIADNSISGYSWRAEKTADELISSKQICPVIMVGISNTCSRASEYIHRSSNNRIVHNSSFGDYTLNAEACGNKYEAFIIKELKTYIDSTYRTLPDASNTAMIGSSMGGLVTYNIGLHNADIFGKLGVMSPAFFWDDMEYLIPEKKTDQKIWMDVGEGEPDYVIRSQEVAKKLYRAGFEPERNFLYYKEPMGIHTEKDWGRRLYMPLVYFFGNIGKPVSMTLEGISKIAVECKDLSINPVIIYESNIKASIIKAEYEIKEKDILDVSEDGKITPMHDGIAKIKCRYKSLTAAKIIEVNKNNHKTVRINIIVKTPENTPLEDDIYFGSFTTMPFKLVRTSMNTFTGVIECKRGSIISYRIRRRENGFMEGDKTAEAADVRQIVADSDKTVNNNVKNWKDTAI